LAFIGNTPVEHGVLEHLVDKGFVVVRSGLRSETSEKLIYNASFLPRSIGDVVDQGQFGLGVGNPYNPDCDVHMYVRDGFSSLRIEGNYFNRHTQLLTLGNRPDPRKLKLMDTPVFPKGIDGFGSLSNMVALPLEEAAFGLAREIERIEAIGDLCVDVSAQLGMMDLFSPFRNPNDFTFELVHYKSGERVSPLDHLDFTHTDPEEKAVVISISLGDASDPWVIGRNIEAREVVLQNPHDLIIMDTDLDFGRQPPIHSPIVEGHDRDALVIILRNSAREIALRALPGLALTGGWQSSKLDATSGPMVDLMNTIATQLNQSLVR